MKHEKIALYSQFSKSSCMQWYMYEFIVYLGIEKKVPNFIEVISNFHRFRHPSHLGSAFKSWIKLHSIKAATTFNNVGKLVICTLLLLKWNGSCGVQIYAKVRNFFFNLKICQEFDDILLHTQAFLTVNFLNLKRYFMAFGCKCSVQAATKPQSQVIFF